jgi:hypothetical protein
LLDPDPKLSPTALDPDADPVLIIGSYPILVNKDLFDIFVRENPFIFNIEFEHYLEF